MYKLENMDKKTIPNWELVNFCEIDKFAAQSYCAVHEVDAEKNIGDIIWEKVSDISNDMMTRSLS
jgi:site-specific DNA-cytosine methylase